MGHLGFIGKRALSYQMKLSLLQAVYQKNKNHLSYTSNLQLSTMDLYYAMSLRAPMDLHGGICRQNHHEMIEMQRREQYRQMMWMKEQEAKKNYEIGMKTIPVVTAVHRAPIEEWRTEMYPWWDHLSWDKRLPGIKERPGKQLRTGVRYRSR